MYLSAVNTQKKDFDRRIQCIENETSEVLKQLQTQLESIRASFVETLNRKTDILDYEKLSEQVGQKMNHDTVLTMLNEAKSDMYVSINEVREDFIQNRKKYEDGVYERASRAEINSEKSREEISKIQSKLEELDESRRAIEDEVVSYTKSICETSKKEMILQVDKLSNYVNTLKGDLDHFSKTAITSIEFEKFKNQNTEEVRDKVNVDEVQRAITGCQNDAINRITACKETILQTINDIDISLKSQIEKKADQTDLETKFEYGLDNSKNLESTVMKQLDMISEQVKDLYKATDEKIHQNEYLAERDKMNLVIESIENELADKMNTAEVKQMFDQKCNIDDVNKALTEVYSELDNKANNNIAQDEINKVLCAEN